MQKKSAFDRIKFFFLGALLVLSLVLLIGAYENSCGRYQLSAWSAGGIGFGAFVVDTTTGEAKMVYLNSGEDKQNHLGKPFNAY